jgi:hypothetical protein
MPATVSHRKPASTRALAIAAAGFMAVLLASTLLLWAHFGGIVFYEMILAGIVACF